MLHASQAPAWWEHSSLAPTPHPQSYNVHTYCMSEYITCSSLGATIVVELHGVMVLEPRMDEVVVS